MKHYAKYGFKEFYIAVGYKGKIIKDYFNKSLFDWKVNLIDTKNSLSVFTSPSAFHAFSDLYEADKTTLVSIGTTTSDYMNSKGFISEIISDEQTYDGVSKAIINYYEAKNIRI